MTDLDAAITASLAEARACMRRAGVAFIRAHERLELAEALARQRPPTPAAQPAGPGPSPEPEAPNNAPPGDDPPPAPQPVEPPSQRPASISAPSPEGGNLDMAPPDSSGVQLPADFRPTDAFTADRARLLTVLWPDIALSAKGIQAWLRTLPGDTFGDNSSTLYSWAKKLGLPNSRIEAAAAAHGTTATPPAPEPPAPAQAAETVATPEPAPAEQQEDPAPAPRRSAAPLSPYERDKAAAIEQLEAGLSARVVADETGLPFEDVSQWRLAVRQRQAQSAWL